MSLESWSWFTQLEGKGNLSRAADDMGVSQQTLSARLASLEKELGAQLVVRSSPLTLTPAGRIFVSYALDHEQARDKMLRQVGSASGDCMGVLRVGVSHTRSRILMPSVVSAFVKSHPHVRVDLLEGTNEEVIRKVEHREVDMAIARFEGPHPGVRVSPLFSEEVVLAIRADLLERFVGLPAPQAVAQLELSGLSALKGCPFLLGDRDDISGRIARLEIRRAGLKVDVAATSQNILTLIAMCAQGIGALFAPSNMLDSVEGRRDDLMRVRLSPDARYEIGLGVPLDAQPWTPAELLEDTIGALHGEG